MLKTLPNINKPELDLTKLDFVAHRICHNCKLDLFVINRSIHTLANFLS